MKNPQWQRANGAAPNGRRRVARLGGYFATGVHADVREAIDAVADALNAHTVVKLAGAQLRTAAIEANPTIDPTGSFA